jgi:hypothetical protein
MQRTRAHWRDRDSRGTGQSRLLLRASTLGAPGPLMLGRYHSVREKTTGDAPENQDAN